jgi:hypothetical protein
LASNKEMRKIEVQARKHGFRTRRTGSGHYKIYSSDGEAIVISFSPGSSTSEKMSRRMFDRFVKEHPHG